MSTVRMTCMTTKKSFEVEDPPVIVLKNGRYAYKVECPWRGKNDKVLHAFKFCSHQAYLDCQERAAVLPTDDKEDATPDKS